MTASRAPLRDGWICGLVALICYSLLAQSTLYGDGAQFAVWAVTGQQLHPVHYLYLPMLSGLSALLGQLGVSFYVSACLLSAVGSAVGVVLTHHGCRSMGASRADCVLVAALVGTCPGIVFFATVLEVHGAFFAFVGLAFWSTVLLLREQSVLAAVGMGLATGAAFCAHGSALMLPAVFGVWAVAEARVAREPLRRLVGLLAVAGIVHAAAVACARWLFAALGAPSGEGVRGYFETMGHETDFWPEVLPTVFYEWVWAFYPISLLGLLGLRTAAGRVRVLALCLCIAPYLAVSLAIVRGMNEHGAYLIPLAIPAAWLVVHSVGRVFSTVAAAVALAVAVAIVWEHDDSERSRELAAGIEAVAAGKPVLMFAADREELEASLAFLPESEFVWMGTLLSFPDGLQQALFDRVALGVREHQARGGIVVLPAGAFRSLEQLAEGGDPKATALLRHFRSGYRNTPVESGRFRGRQLELP